MWQRRLVFFCLTLTQTFACKSPVAPMPKLPVKDPHIVWRYERSKKGFYTTPILYNDVLVCGMQSDEDSSRGFSLVGLTADSGRLLWQNDDFDERFNPFGSQDVQSKDGIIVLSEANRIHAVDALTGKMIWKDEIEGGDYCICIIDNWIYKNTVVDKQTSSLFRYELLTGRKEHVLTLDKNGFGSGFTPTLRMPVRWNHPSGDEVLILNNRSFDWEDTKEPRMDLLAYNITADSMLWYRQGVDNSSSSSRPVIDEDRVYFFGSFFVHCIDAATGKTIWTFRTTDKYGDFNTANIVIVGDLLIAKPDSYWIYAVHKKTGRKVYARSNTAPTPNLIQVRNDTLWFADNAILAITASNGKKIIDWEGPEGWWSAPVTPNPSNATIYTTDGSYIYCIDPNHLPRINE